jgi:glutamyl-tRNA reductase
VSEPAVSIPRGDSDGFTAERQLVPDARFALAALLGYGDRVRDEALARAERRLRSLSPEARRAVEALAARIIEEFLHVPATRLREAAGSPEGLVYASVAHGLFGANGSAR